jgi:IS605 OrfB family transposase
VFKVKIEAYAMPNTTTEYSVFKAVSAWAQHGTNCEHRDMKELSMSISVDGRSILKGVLYKNNITSVLTKMIIVERDVASRAKGDRLSKAETLRKKSILKKFCFKEKIETKSICEVLYSRQSGKFTLAVPVDVKPVDAVEKSEIVAVDPGVRPFMAFYSPDYYGYIGGNWSSRASKLLKTNDSLLERAKASTRCFQRAKLRKAAARCREKCRNLVDNMHKQTAHFLVTNYKYILLPKMNTRDMVSAEHRKINSSVARAIMTSSQYSFREKLIRKASEYNSTVILCREHYTSKTCTSCGNLHPNLGGNKTYDCIKCGMSVHRDYNGARNILLKNLLLRDNSSCKV